MSVPVPAVSPDLTVAEVAARQPRATEVFERLGIDYCCGGHRPLGEVVAEKGLDWASVGAQIQAAIAAPAVAGGPASWADARLADLIGHIVGHYHAKLREDLPMLTAVGEKVVGAHGEHHPEVRDVASIVGDVRAELEGHMMKEEHVLFPFIEQLESGLGHQHPMLGRIAGPIGMMMHEHEFVGRALARLRTITSDYAVPADACPTYRRYYEGLTRFERELHEHIHLENNVLFPRAQEMEARVLAAR